MRVCRPPARFEVIEQALLVAEHHAPQRAALPEMQLEQAHLLAGGVVLFAAGAFADALAVEVAVDGRDHVAALRQQPAQRAFTLRVGQVLVLRAAVAVQADDRRHRPLAVLWGSPGCRARPCRRRCGTRTAPACSHRDLRPTRPSRGSPPAAAASRPGTEATSRGLCRGLRSASASNRWERATPRIFRLRKVSGISTHGSAYFSYRGKPPFDWAGVTRTWAFKGGENAADSNSASKVRYMRRRP